MKPTALFTATAVSALSALAFQSIAMAAGSDAACHASAPRVAPTVVELYTSEGCSSCPPADKWLSTLKGKPDVLALAFHVNYWDQLGWTDRFASREATQRQYDLSRLAGANGVYTPQVIVNGRDGHNWNLPKAGSTPVESPVSVTLVREGDVVTAQVASSKAVGEKLSGYWAVLEDGHQSKVRAGENAGETLNHDHVVRLYRPVEAWQAAAGTQQKLTVSRGVAETPRRVVFVVTDSNSARPLQAAVLGC